MAKQPKVPKAPFTFENNFDKAIAQIEERPHKVLQIIGVNLVKEIRATTVKQMYKQRKGFLSKVHRHVGISFWARKQEKDLLVGAKAPTQMVKKILSGAEPEPIKPVFVKNVNVIGDAIQKALEDIAKG
jgi:hypothetical protein